VHMFLISIWNDFPPVQLAELKKEYVYNRNASSQ